MNSFAMAFTFKQVKSAAQHVPQRHCLSFRRGARGPTWPSRQRCRRTRRRIAATQANADLQFRRFWSMLSETRPVGESQQRQPACHTSYRQRLVRSALEETSAYSNNMHHQTPQQVCVNRNIYPKHRNNSRLAATFTANTATQLQHTRPF